MRRRGRQRQTLKVGSLVKIDSWGRHTWLVVRAPVGARRRSELQLVSGYWYSNGQRVLHERRRSVGYVHDHRCYGKIIPLEGRVVGYVRTHYAAFKHLR